MYELPEILFFVSALLMLVVLAATTTRWRIAATLGYLACVSASAAIVWGAAWTWLAVLLASGLLALLLVTQQSLYSLGGPSDHSQQAEMPIANEGSER